MLQRRWQRFVGTLLVNGTSEQLYETNETIHLAFPAEKLVILEK